MNYRLQNIYNISTSSRQFLLKFSIPDSKKVIVVDCGNKLHLTDFDRPITQTPSNFVTKLRKHLKTRRLSQLKQIGNDRVLVFQFSDGMFYLVLEFFSAGNILLLDNERKIISLQRMVNDKGNNDRYAVNETYNMFDESLFEQNYSYEKQQYSSDQIKEWIATHRQKLEEKSNSVDTKKKNKVFSIHKLIFVNASHLSSDLIQKTLYDFDINASASCLEFSDSPDKLNIIVGALQKAEEVYIQLTSPSDEELNGFIVSKKNPSYNPEDKDITEDLEFVYDEFHPIKPYKEHPELFKFEEIKGYNKTLDIFFSTLESTKYALRIEQQKQQAAKRIDHARLERDKQIQSLVNQQEAMTKKGDTIMYYADLVDSCRASVQKLLDQQMDWTNIESVIKLEQSRGNEVAQVIKLPLNLKENKISVLLPDIDAIDDEISKSSSDDSESESSESESSSDSDSDSDSDDDIKVKKPKRSTPKAKKTIKQQKVSIVIDLSLSPFANARQYFGTKKVAETKQAKVEKSTQMALQNAQRKIDRDLTQNLKSENESLKMIRPKYWFEKFLWFVSSEGYLCLAGRDDSQTDMIYYRHFNDNDAVVSSDIDGSLLVFVKNPFKGEGIPPSTLMQAGIFSMSASSAWNGKVTTSAWVIDGVHISKKDYDGSLIRSGHFNYKAKKEYLPPSQLAMGFGFYWLGDEETTEKYKQLRLEREGQHGLKIVMHNKKADLENVPIKPKSVSSEVNEEPEKVEDSSKQVTQDDNDAELKATENESPVSEPKSQIEPPQQDLKEKDGKKRLSAKERRNLRKGKASSPEQDDDDVVDPIKDSLQKLQIKEQNEKKAEPQQKPPNVRGKKAKLKKIASKYAAQDEEEKQMRMDALGTLKQVKDLEAQRLQESSQDDQKAKETKYVSNVAERKKKQEEREYQKYIMEEVNEDESSITNYLEILDSLIAKPQATDTVSNVVPVFAPWTSLNKLKYKVKIQPGMGKKGKAINESLNYFTNRKMDPLHQDTDLDWENEREIINGTKPNDLVGVFTVSKVKLVLPGGNNGADKGSGKKSSAKKGTGKKK